MASSSRGMLLLLLLEQDARAIDSSQLHSQSLSSTRSLQSMQLYIS